MAEPHIFGSSEEFVGESVGVNPPTTRGDSPMRPSENQHKNLAKKEEQEAFCRPPAGRGRAGCVRRRLNKNLPELAPVPGKNFMFWARLRCRFGGDQRRDTGRQPTATPKMAFGTRSGVTLKSVTGSTGLQNAGLNMLRATWNPLKQCRLPMRLLCVPYFQETSGTHRFCGPGRK